MTFTARGLYASSSKERRGGRGLSRILLVIGSLIALAAVFWAVSLILSFSTTSTTTESADQSGVTAIELDNETPGDVHIVASDDDTAVVEATLRDNVFATAQNSISGEETLNIHADCDQRFVGSCSVDYEISVPTGTDVSLRGGTGNVTVEDTGGDVEVEHSTGDAFISGAGDVTASTSTGNVTLEDTEGSAEATTTTGDVRVSGSGESLTVGTTTGNIDATDFEAAEVNATSTTGDQSLSAGEGTLQADATTGNVNIAAGAETSEVRVGVTTGDVNVTLAEGIGAVQVEGDSSTGDRDIDFATDPEAGLRLDLTTTTGNVYVSAG